ncbi:MAG: 16S rRNA (guanine(966)-N(2))-methyltransferase RsmD [Lachnospiraceae bacterium]|jgi:16S rRNA (guanine966-N2)-methyltransferase|nr:16S rRNA (guanine(966)-N(2))-methyltransferase RsmD [Lachnospiraceae bacterium]
MRIIAGKCKSMPLKTPKGDHTRPTTDRIKETLFNIINYELRECRFLDLFAGSGGIGLEAVSRGASYAVLVENNKEAIRCIEENIAFTGLGVQTRLIKKDVLSAIAEMEGQAPFDIVFMDPPYEEGYEKPVLLALKKAGLVDPYTIIIIEADKKTEFAFLKGIGFELFKYKAYKTNAHAFVALVEED